jgi:steroid 5-alpha reductase family enzyme
VVSARPYRIRTYSIAHCERAALKAFSDSHWSLVLSPARQGIMGHIHHGGACMAAIVALGLVFSLFTGTWFVSVGRKDVSLVDRVWGVGFILAAGAFLAFSPALRFRSVLVFALVLIWGVRLSLHIYFRNRGKPEDPRYQAMRAQHGAQFDQSSLWRVFYIQAAILLVVSSPLYFAIQGPRDGNWLDVLACFVWGVGFYWEVQGDRQLARFKANPAHRGTILRTGLWRYSRHPNYFGESLLWWGFFLFALSASFPQGLWAVVSPALMLFLLLRVSGVALLEKTLASRPGYAEYAKETSAFLPWFSKASRPVDRRKFSGI